MVYCSNCGAQNRDGNLKCSNCGKPLPLIPNEAPKRPIHFSINNQSFNANPQHSHSIKDKYMGRNQNSQQQQNNQQQNQQQQHQQQQYQNHQNQNNYQNQQNKQYNQKNNQQENQYQDQQRQQQQNYQNNPNQERDQYHPYNQNYQDYRNYKDQEYSSKLYKKEQDQQYSQNYVNKPKKISKTAVEWDVVIATALMVIILTAILQRIFPFLAIFKVLLIGLAYILLATKSKSSLAKSIPLVVLVILAISAYFSI